MKRQNKKPHTRLSGKKLYSLNLSIHERDANCCVECKRFVEPGVKFHHVVFKSQRGEDVAENGVTLCTDCHNLAHGPNAKHYQEKFEKYLHALYPDF